MLRIFFQFHIALPHRLRHFSLIVKGDPKEAEKVLLTENPTIVDVLPLTLEEIFIYELGGVDYEVKDILL